jgi:hypothetical protein
MKKGARLDATIAEFLAAFEQQKELRKRSRLSDKEFDKTFSLYVENPYRESSMVDTTSATSQQWEIGRREELEKDYADFERTKGLQRAFLESIFASNAEVFTRLKALQKSSELPPEEFSRALVEYQRRQLLKPTRKAFPGITLETAKTPEEHLAIYRRYGVLWWWKLKEDDVALWNGRILMDKVVENGVEYRIARSFSDLFKHRYHKSAFEYERLARNNKRGKPPKFEFGKPWCMLTKEQMDELARRLPMPQGERIPYLWRTCCSEPWANECVLGNYAFDLRSSLSTLAEAFKKIIKFEQQRFGMKPLPRKGNRVKPFEWKAVQYVDLHNYETPKFRDKDSLSKAASERSARSRVLKRPETPKNARG